MPGPPSITPAPVTASTPGAIYVAGTGRGNPGYYYVPPAVAAANADAALRAQGSPVPGYVFVPSSFAPRYGQGGQSGGELIPGGWVNPNAGGGGGWLSSFLGDPLGTVGNTVTDFVKDPAKSTTQFFENPGVTEAAVLAAIALSAGAAGGAGAGAAGTGAAGAGAAGAGTLAGIGVAAPSAAALAMPTLSMVVSSPALALGSAISATTGIAMTEAVATFVGSTIINTAANGGDVGKALVSAGTSLGIDLVGEKLTEAAGLVVKDIPGLSNNAKAAIASGLSNASIAMAQGKSGLPALAGAATGYVANSITDQIPGINNLPLQARKIASASIAAELNGKSPSQAAFNTALRLGGQAAANYVDNNFPDASQTVKDTANNIRNGLGDVAVDIGKTISDTATSVKDGIKQGYQNLVGREPNAEELSTAETSIMAGGNVEDTLTTVGNSTEAQAYDQAHTDVGEATLMWKAVYGDDAEPTTADLANYLNKPESEVEAALNAQFTTSELAKLPAGAQQEYTDSLASGQTPDQALADAIAWKPTVTDLEDGDQTAEVDTGTTTDAGTGLPAGVTQKADGTYRDQFGNWVDARGQPLYKADGTLAQPFPFRVTVSSDTDEEDTTPGGQDTTTDTTDTGTGGIGVAPGSGTGEDTTPGGIGVAPGSGTGEDTTPGGIGVAPGSGTGEDTTPGGIGVAPGSGTGEDTTPGGIGVAPGSGTGEDTTPGGIGVAPGSGTGEDTTPGGIGVAPGSGTGTGTGTTPGGTGTTGGGGGGTGTVNPPVQPPVRPPVTPSPTPSSTTAAEENARIDNLVDEILGFNVSEKFDPLWLLKDRSQTNTTKIASGGYLDDLLADPTSFDDLLRTLRS